LFEWAEYLNNYYLNIKYVDFQLRNYNLISYQTELYDERESYLRIFSKEEQELLQYHYWLLQWPEFCRSKELFCVIDDNQSQEKAEIFLQNFDIVIRHSVLCIGQCITGIDSLCETVASAVP
jgi:hypothetical protein